MPVGCGDGGVVATVLVAVGIALDTDVAVAVDVDVGTGVAPGLVAVGLGVAVGVDVACGAKIDGKKTFVPAGTCPLADGVADQSPANIASNTNVANAVIIRLGEFIVCPLVVKGRLPPTLDWPRGLHVGCGGL